MLSDDELRARVGSAEQALAGGDWSRALRLFQQLTWTIVDGLTEQATLGYNESLVVHRFADIAVQAGRIREALDAYALLQTDAVDLSSRALAAFKHLDLAVVSGHGLLAKDVF